jgi:hypothetical protein
VIATLTPLSDVTGCGVVCAELRPVQTITANARPTARLGKRANRTNIALAAVLLASKGIPEFQIVTVWRHSSAASLERCFGLLGQGSLTVREKSHPETCQDIFPSVSEANKCRQRVEKRRDVH